MNDPVEVQNILQMHLKGTSTLEEYLDAHFLAIQYPKEYQTYQLLQKLWKKIIYKQIMDKRSKISKKTLSVSNFTAFVNYLIGWFSVVLTRMELNSHSLALVFNCYIYMGDLARYRDQFVNGSFKMSMQFYKQAENIYPQNGMVHHQMAVVATLLNSDLEALYRYIRSLYGPKSPDMAVENLKKFVDHRVTELPSIPPTECNLEMSLIFLVKANMSETSLKNVYSEYFINSVRQHYSQLSEDETTWIALICAVFSDNEKILTELLNFSAKVDYKITMRYILFLLVGKKFEYFPPGLQQYRSDSQKTPSMVLPMDFNFLGFTPLQRGFEILELPVNFKAPESVIGAIQYFETIGDASMFQSVQEWVNFVFSKHDDSSEDELVFPTSDLKSNYTEDSQLQKLAEQTAVSLFDDF
eukprot:NODE_54_length_30443_cov_1.442954.p8 type:complete len:412 gc:universal NODE_54_length_30443_cov_1.442954:9969-8734(-)